MGAMFAIIAVRPDPMNESFRTCMIMMMMMMTTMTMMTMMTMMMMMMMMMMVVVVVVVVMMMMHQQRHNKLCVKYLSELAAPERRVTRVHVHCTDALF